MLVVFLQQDCIARPARLIRLSQFSSASTIAIVIKTSSVGHTHSIGIASQYFVGQMVRSDLFSRVPIITWISLPVMIFAANQAITFLIQRVPLPESIEWLQDGQFFFIG